MLKLRKYLKPFAVSVLVIVALLFAQAMCELTMPDYMSNIVNVGINSNGIEDGEFRFVTTNDTSREDIDRALDIFESIILHSRRSAPPG